MRKYPAFAAALALLAPSTSAASADDPAASPEWMSPWATLSLLYQADATIAVVSCKSAAAAGGLAQQEPTTTNATPTNATSTAATARGGPAASAAGRLPAGPPSNDRQGAAGNLCRGRGRGCGRDRRGRRAQRRQEAFE